MITALPFSRDEISSIAHHAYHELTMWFYLFWHPAPSFELAVAVSLMMQQVAETRQMQGKQLQDLQQQQDKVRKELEDLRQFYAAEMKNANYRYQVRFRQINGAMTFSFCLTLSVCLPV